jgi:hypothetical protein
MAQVTINVTDTFVQLVSKFNELSAGVGSVTDLDIAGESDVVNILTAIYNLIDSDTDFRSKISVTDAGGDGSLTYNSSTGVITYTGPSATEARAHISVTDAGGDGSLTYNSTSGVITYTGPSATEVRAHFSAGTNTTYASGQFSISDATIRSKISVTDAGGDGSLSYNSTSGVITYTGPSASEVRAHFSAGNGIAITSGSVALKSVETFIIYDSAGTALRTLYAAGSL